MHDPGYLLLPLRARDGTVRGHAIIDAADRHLAEHRWYLNSRGYVVRTSYVDRKRTLRLARVILGLEPGDPREGDHINRDKLDHRRANLRPGPHALNAQNVPARGGTSQHRGVSWHVRIGKWMAYARLNGKRVHLGYFGDEQEAADEASAYRRAHMPFANERHAVRMRSPSP